MKSLPAELLLLSIFFFKAQHYFWGALKCLESFQVDATLMVFWLQHKGLNGEQNPLVLKYFHGLKC